MIRLIPSRRQADEADMERLLRGAGCYEPEDEAPAGLEWRALSGLQARRVSELRRQRVGLVAGLAACVVVALFLVPRGRPGVEMADIDGRILPPEPLGGGTRRAAQPPTKLVSYTSPPSVEHHSSHVTRHASSVKPHSSGLTDGASRLMDDASRITDDASRITDHASRFPRHASRVTPRRKRSRPARTAPRMEPPTVRWQVETVRYEVAQMLTPGYFVEGKDENGELKVTPGVLELVTRSEPEVVRACGEPAPDSVPPNETEPGSAVVPPGAPVEEKKDR